MSHAYKNTLLRNLCDHYNRPDWQVKIDYRKGHDEILFVVAATDDVAAYYEDLFNVLSTLPEVRHPHERVLISFCKGDLVDYCSRLINPTNQDKLNLALLGKLPERKRAMLNPFQAVPTSC